MRAVHSRMVAMRLVFVFVVALLGLPLGVAHAAGDVSWRSYDVTVDVGKDGVLHVTEAIKVEFDGSFHEGHRAIPLTYIERIDNVRVSVENGSGKVAAGRELARSAYTGAPGTFTTYTADGELHIDYGFLPTGTATAASDLRSIVLEYDAIGAIRVYNDVAEPYQEIRWTAISSEITDIASVDRASATIRFPEDVAADQMRFDPAPTSASPREVRWARQGMTSGNKLQVLAAFPSITAATEPSWQPAAEKEDAAHARQQHREEIVLGLSIPVGLAAVVAFVLTMIFMRRASRRHNPGMVAEYLAEQPDDLPAGLAGALIDRSFDAQDAMGMLVELERRGVIEMREKTNSSKRAADPDRYTIILHQPLNTVPDWERPMLDGLFGKNAKTGKHVSFLALKTLRAKHESSVKDAVEKELFDRGFYEELPDTTRGRWNLRFVGLALVFLLIAGGMALWTGSFPAPVVILGVLVIGLAILGIILADSSTIKSEAGEEATARWQAFARYLKRMEKEMPVPERLALFDRYLPYAIVLGFDDSWKSWMTEPARDDDDVEFDRPGQRAVVQPVHRSSTSSSGDGGGMPSVDLQGMSNRALTGLQAGSASVFMMLNAGVDSFKAGASSSSSGGSGGGSSSVGSSGGGSHSFS